MRKPTFMEGTEPVPIDDLAIAPVDPARIRPVSWAAPPQKGPGLPEPVAETPRSPPPAVAAPPRPVYKDSQPGEFVPVKSEPVPVPAAPPPPPPTGFSELAAQKLEAALAALASQGERLAEQARADALELGILIARRIVEREIAVNLESTFSLIKSALRMAGEEHVTRVRLNPRDVERFEAAVHTEFSLGKVQLAPDPSLKPGDVMVDTPSHSVDGRLATRFEELVRQLDGAGS
jgi:hypothetical protein